MALSGANDDEKIKDLLTKSHKAQAIWFLNAFWKSTGAKEAERIWSFVQKFNQLDLQKGKDGTSLDEFTAHKFLESFQETMTVVDLRNKLREVGAIPAQGRPKDFPITHFLIARFGADWHTLVNAKQGDNAEEIAKAQKLLDEAQAAIPEAQKRDAESKAAAAEQKRQQQIVDDKTAELKKNLRRAQWWDRTVQKLSLHNILQQIHYPFQEQRSLPKQPRKRLRRPYKKQMPVLKNLKNIWQNWQQDQEVPKGRCGGLTASCTKPRLISQVVKEAIKKRNSNDHN